MTDAFDTELYFLIAKFLKERFPEIGDLFIKECEQKNLFPSRVFMKNPSFQTLDNKILAGIPNDQLIRLIKLACPKSQFPSLFFHEPNETGSSIANSNEIKKSDLITYNLGKPENELQNISAYQRIIGHFDKCYCICIDITSQILITGADDGIIKIWKVPEMVLMKTFPRIHFKEISEIVVHPTNKYFASCSLDGIVNIFSLTKGVFMKSFDMHAQVHSLRFSPCGRYLAAACDKGIIQIFEIHSETDEIVEYYDISIKNDCSWLSFSPCGQLLAIAADNGMLCILQIYMRQIVILNGHNDNTTVDFVHFANTKPTCLISLATKEKGLKSWTCNNSLWGKISNFSTRTQAGRSTKSKLVSCSFNCDDTKVIGISQNNIFVWDSNTHKQTNIMQMPLYTEHCSCLAANPRYPTIIYVGTNDGYSSIWDIETGEALSYYRVREGGRINDALWSRDGIIVYTVDEYGGITEAKTCFSNTCPSTQMFFPFEPTDDLPTPENSKFIVDAEGIMLDPQPKIWKLEDMRLECYIKRRSKDQEDTEKQIKLFWQKQGSIPFSDYTGMHVIEEEDEEDRNETTDDENVQRTIYSFEEIPVKINIQRNPKSGSSRILSRKNSSNSIDSYKRASTNHLYSDENSSDSLFSYTQHIAVHGDESSVPSSQFVPFDSPASSQNDYKPTKQKKSKTRKNSTKQKIIYESDLDQQSPILTTKTKQKTKNKKNGDVSDTNTKKKRIITEIISTSSDDLPKDSRRKTNSNKKSSIIESDEQKEIKPQNLKTKTTKKETKKRKRQESSDLDEDYQPTQIPKYQSDYSDGVSSNYNAFDETETTSDYYQENTKQKQNSRTKSIESTEYSSSDNDYYPNKANKKNKTTKTNKSKTKKKNTKEEYSEESSSSYSDPKNPYRKLSITFTSSDDFSDSSSSDLSSSTLEESYS